MHEGTATDLQIGDEFGFGAMDLSDRHNDNIKVEGLDLTDDGLLRIAGVIAGGRDRGFRGAWVVQLTQRVEYRRPLATTPRV